ncbi:MAG TPA: DUF4272 domain-containing protein [Labilithrix sp.]
MTTNAAVYASLAALPASAVVRCAAGADASIDGEDDAWDAIELRFASGVELSIAHMTDDAQRARHLQGFAGYVFATSGKKMNAHVHAILDRVLRTRHVLGMTAAPAFDQASIAFVRRLCEETKSILFLNGGVLDDCERTLLAPDGAVERGAEVPRFASSLARKARSDALLTKNGVSVQTTLPPIPGDEESILRTPAEIARRAKCVIAVAVHGEEPDSAFATKLVKDAGVWDDTTEEERTFLANEKPTDHERAQFTWQYEGLAVLLWALGRVELGPPSAICDVPALAKIIAHTSLADLASKSSPRSLEQALDAADLFYRMHWATTDARANGRKPPPGLDPGVVVERRRAAYWLVRHRDAPWDDITLDT